MSESKLFKPYPVSPQVVRQLVSFGRRHVDALDNLEVDSQVGPSGGAQFGSTERRTRSVLTTTTRRLDAFASAIVEFNETSETPRSVARLNEVYRAQKEANFGLDPADYEPGGAREERSYERDLDAARANVTGALHDEYQRLSSNLSAKAKELGLG